jgi:hypothetical protein
MFLFERTRRRKLRSNFRRSGSEFIILRMHMMTENWQFGHKKLHPLGNSFFSVGNNFFFSQLLKLDFLDLCDYLKFMNVFIMYLLTFYECLNFMKKMVPPQSSSYETFETTFSGKGQFSIFNFSKWQFKKKH